MCSWSSIRSTILLKPINTNTLHHFCTLKSKISMTLYLGTIILISGWVIPSALTISGSMWKIAESDTEKKGGKTLRKSQDRKITGKVKQNTPERPSNYICHIISSLGILNLLDRFTRFPAYACFLIFPPPPQLFFFSPPLFSYCFVCCNYFCIINIFQRVANITRRKKESYEIEEKKE